MRGLFGFFILSRLFRNPFLALVVIVVMYFIVDQRFVGLLPNVIRPLQRGNNIRRLRQELAVNPAHAPAHLELGTLLAEKKRWKDALPHLEKAAERLENSQSLFQLGVAYFHLKRYEEGKEALDAALALNPRIGYGEPYLYFMEYSLQQHDTERLLELEHILREYGSVEVYYRAGRLWDRAGEKDRAHTMYREAWKTHRGNPSFLRRQQRRYALRAWWFSRFSS